MSNISLFDKEFSLFIVAGKIQDEVQRIADRMNDELKAGDVIFVVGYGLDWGYGRNLKDLYVLEE